ncbi:hypothetical protein OV203_02545 [Nannocystis sp. ILAH1]|uniref:hypothetical protein n=1 Tax=Nannocystis sp. ILAH1 TaxID=2996789 RepID=UPI0022721FA4|nr:hypothetical protein [Nannocystis sp. ILAH1]MCY0985991.1 hypothetical protein [Nannocystis sp. ILAH1]
MTPFDSDMPTPLELAVKLQSNLATQRARRFMLERGTGASAAALSQMRFLGEAATPEQLRQELIDLEDEAEWQINALVAKLSGASRLAEIEKSLG